MITSPTFIKGSYIAAIISLLTAIVIVQTDSVTLINKASAKHIEATEENQSIISIVDTIANLYLLLPVFIEPEKRIGLSIDERKAREQEFLSHINQLPVDKIIGKMKDLELVTTEQLSKIEHKRPYINRLAEVAMNGIMTPEIPEVAIHGKIHFKSGLEDSRANTFETTNKAIYAFFDTSAYQDENIFVKWYESKQGRMALFKQFPIAQENTNYIWIHNSGGFTKGQYQVEVYRINESFDLLSKGNFEVR